MPGVIDSECSLHPRSEATENRLSSNDDALAGLGSCGVLVDTENASEDSSPRKQSILVGTSVESSSSALPYFNLSCISLRVVGLQTSWRMDVGSLGQLMDEIEIKSLLVRERYYRDTCQWQKLRESYHPDASKTSIDISWFTGDIDGFVSGSQAMSQGGVGALHVINPVEIHIRGSKALSESTGNIQIRIQHQGEEYDLVSWTRFISRLSKTIDGWRFLTLDAIYDRDTLTPVLPTQAATIKPHDLGPRMSYRCISWVLSQRGFKIRQDLPGTDRPESVTKLMKSAFDWLN